MTQFIKYLFLSVILLTGCEKKDIRREYIDTKEIVTILDVSYSPEVEGDGARVGISLNGDIGIISGGSGQPERHIVILKGPKGKFTIEDKSFWSLVEEGNRVELTWRRFINTEYKDGKAVARYKTYPRWDTEGFRRYVPELDTEQVLVSTRILN